MTMIMKGRLMLKDDGSQICGGIFSKDRSKEIRLYWNKGQGVEIQVIEYPSVNVKSQKFKDDEFEKYQASLQIPDLTSLWEEIKLRIGQFESGNPPIYPMSK